MFMSKAKGMACFMKNCTSEYILKIHGRLEFFLFSLSTEQRMITTTCMYGNDGISTFQLVIKLSAICTWMTTLDDSKAHIYTLDNSYREQHSHHWEGG